MRTYTNATVFHKDYPELCELLEDNMGMRLPRIVAGEQDEHDRTYTGFTPFRVYELLSCNFTGETSREFLKSCWRQLSDCIVFEGGSEVIPTDDPNVFLLGDAYVKAEDILCGETPEQNLRSLLGGVIHICDASELPTEYDIDEAYFDQWRCRVAITNNSGGDTFFYESSN